MVKRYLQNLLKSIKKWAEEEVEENHKKNDGNNNSNDDGKSNKGKGNSGKGYMEKAKVNRDSNFDKSLYNLRIC